MRKKIFSVLILVLSINFVFAQNITDKNGLKQGKWSKQYESGRLQYKGEFKDGIEVGLFVFYYENGDVKAKGKIENRHPDGEWIVYNLDRTIQKDEDKWRFFCKRF